jgi:intracellular septation protein
MARELTPIEKHATEIGPLVAFVAAYYWAGLNAATIVTIAATALGLAVTYAISRKVTKVAAFTLVLLVVFGGLTLYLNDPKYFKLKVTVINLIFALMIFGGLLLNRIFLKDLLGEAMQLGDVAWRTLSVRWGVFFLVLAIANEYVWRSFSEATWVLFKFPGLLVVTVLFAVANAPFMMRNMIENGDEGQKPSANG